jgi:glycosyltransferase involved in cell wall biosynthesis
MGYVSEEEKLSVLSKSKLLINTSYKEGWSLVNIEANARGIPAIAFKVEGNVESVIDGVTGFLIEPYDTVAMSSKICAVLNDTVKVNFSECVSFAKSFDWDVKSLEFYKILSRCAKLK